MRKTFSRGNIAGSYAKITLNTDALDEIQSALASKFKTRVGILGNKTTRHAVVTTKAGLRKAGRSLVPQTNAEIGLVHEKGSLTLHVPRRSFLEMPLVLKSAGLLAIRNKLWAIFLAGERTKERLKEAYRNLGLLAERIIQAAFESRGFGKWAPDSDSTQKRKGSDMPLIDSGQLRRAITSDVVNK
jgi:hypothetical protein